LSGRKDRIFVNRHTAVWHLLGADDIRPMPPLAADLGGAKKITAKPPFRANSKLLLKGSQRPW
jgi:hypothetical protein